MITYIDIKDCVELGANENTIAVIKLENNSEYELQFAHQKTGFGSKMFFVCPVCGKRRTKLYLFDNSIMCRECYPFPVYQNIKNVKQCGYKYIAHRMRKYAQANGIQLKRFPFRYLDYEKPKYKHLERWLDTITKFQALENMRKQSLFFNKNYSLDVINSIFKNENIYLYVCDLQELEVYRYDWAKGYEEFKTYLKNGCDNGYK